jgi:sugar phosphate isomerase/epimerase
LANIPVGLQLYTLRDETSHDFVGTLKKVADIGYKAVEFAGYGDIPAKEMKKVLDGLGLKAASSHVGLPFLNRELLESTLAYHIEYNKEIGSEYIVVPWAPFDGLTSIEELQPYLDDLKVAAEACKQAGIGFAYHNHAMEFAKIGDKTIHEIIFESLDPELLLVEMDLYWVKKAGLDPKSYLCKYKGRAPLIHVKDMTADDRGFFTEVGRGIINYPAIFDKAEELGVKYYIVEQDQCERPPLESIRMSYDYLKTLGIV